MQVAVCCRGRPHPDTSWYPQECLLQALCGLCCAPCWLLTRFARVIILSATFRSCLALGSVVWMRSCWNSCVTMVLKKDGTTSASAVASTKHKRLTHLSMALRWAALRPSLVFTVIPAADQLPSWMGQLKQSGVGQDSIYEYLAANGAARAWYAVVLSWVLVDGRETSSLARSIHEQLLSCVVLDLCGPICFAHSCACVRTR